MVVSREVISLISVALFAILPLLVTSADSDTADSWRCGIFFAGNEGTPPRAKIFVLPKKFPADCSKPQPEVYKSTCFEVMKKGLKDWDFQSASRIRPTMGFTIGDDLCSPVPRDIRAPGLEMGFYFAYCGSDWIDTGLRKPEKLCCKDKKQVDC